MKVRQQCEQLFDVRLATSPALKQQEATDPSHTSPPLPWITIYLQDENEVVDGLAPLIDVVMRRALLVFAELDLLDHIGVAQDS